MVNDWSAFSQRGGDGAGDHVIYYRKPDTGLEAGWVIWADSLSGTKLRDFIYRGFEPLMKYGRINTAERDNRRFGDSSHGADPAMTRELYLWEAILSHPDGPAEFPLSQVVAYRWYRPEHCPVADAYFPQLVGKKIREYTCPEHCGRAPFVEVDGVGGIGSLRQHLRVMHGWDQANLQAYGQRVGIDFNKADVEELTIANIEYAPSATLSCPRCGQEFRGGMAAARLARHEKNHPVAEIVTT